VLVNFGPGDWLAVCGRGVLVPAGLGAGGSGGASAALPVGLLLAGPAAVLLVAAGAGQRAG